MKGDELQPGELQLAFITTFVVDLLGCEIESFLNVKAFTDTFEVQLTHFRTTSHKVIYV